jgi:hypothetical protein
MSGAQAARWLGIGQPAVQRSVVREGKDCARVESARPRTLWSFSHNKALKQDRPHNTEKRKFLACSYLATEVVGKMDVGRVAEVCSVCQFIWIMAAI